MSWFPEPERRFDSYLRMTAATDHELLMLLATGEGRSVSC
jgi:hypothetical protein